MTDVSIGDVTELDQERDTGLRIEIAPGARSGPARGQGAPGGTVTPTGRLEEAMVGQAGSDELIGDDSVEDLRKRIMAIDPSILQASPQKQLLQTEPVAPQPSMSQSLIGMAATQAGVPPAAITRETLYRPTGPGGDKEDAFVVPVDLLPQNYYYNDPIGGILRAVPNALYSGVDEALEFVTGKELYELFPDYFDKDTGTKKSAVSPGNIAADIAYDLAEMLPPTLATLLAGNALGAYLRGTSGIAKTAQTLARLAIAPARPVLNPLSQTISRMKPLTQARIAGVGKGAKESLKFGAAAAVGEQIVTDPEELQEMVNRGDGILVPRIGKVLADADYPLISDLGRSIMENRDNPEALQRLYKAADDMLVGMVFDGTVYSATFLGHQILKKAGLLTDKAKILDPGVDPTVGVDLPSPDELAAAIKQQLDENKSAFSVEEFEEISKLMYEDGGFLRIEELLEKANIEYGPLKKYFGSINATKIQASETEAIYFIKHFADMAERKAREAGEDFPPTKPYTATEQDANLFGLQNAEALQETLTKMTADGTPLKMHSYMSGVELGPGLEGLDVYVMASRQALVRSADHLTAMAKDAQRLQNSDNPLERTAGKAAFLQAYMAHGKLQETVSGIANQAGRALSSFNIPATGAPKLEYIQKIVQEGGKDLDDIIASIVQADDTAEVARVLNTLDDKTERMMKNISTLWYNSILSSVDTQLVNLAGGLYVRVMRDVFETPLAAATNRAKQALGIEVPPGAVMPEDAMARIKSYVSKDSLGTRYDDATKDSRVLTMLQTGRLQDLLGSPKPLNNINDVDAFLRSEGVSDPRTRLRALAQKEIEMEVLSGSTNAMKIFSFFKRAYMGDPKTLHRFRSGASEFVEKARPEFDVVAENTVARKIANTAANVVTVPGRVMTGVDTALKTASQNAMLFEGASRIIRNMRYQIEKNGNKPLRIRLGSGEVVTVTSEMLDPNVANATVLGDFMHQLVSDPPPSLLEEANKEALKDVFQQSTKFTRGMHKFRDLLDLRVMGVPLPIGTMLAPFVRTPVNLVTYSMDRIPLVSLYSKENREALRSSGAARDMQLARQRVGLAMLTGFYAAAASGYIVGADPAGVTSKQRATLRGTGFRKDAIVDPSDGRYYPINRLDPASMMAGTAARLHQATQTFARAPGLTEAERQDVSLRLMMVGNELFSNMLSLMDDKLYIQSFVNFAQAFENPYDLTGADFGKKVAGRVSQTVGRSVSGFVPLSAFIRRSEEAYRTFSKMSHDDFRTLNTETRIKLINDGMAMYEAGFLYDARIRETRIMRDWADTFLVNLSSGIPGLQKMFDYELYPKVDQFGKEIDRDRAVPTGVPVTRTSGGPDPMRPDEFRGKTVVDSHAFMNQVLLNYGFDDLRTDRDLKVTVGTETVSVPLTADQYYYRQRIQGTMYAQQIHSLITNQKFYQNHPRPYSDDTIKQIIKDARAFAKRHADAKTTLLYTRMFSPESLDTRARKIITVQKLEEEYETSAKDAMDLYTALGKRIAGTDGVVVLPRGDE
tara:strand:+ start:2618 stop:7192 length:4575 start_codon:yes stop_codon:yes gene_type:complete